MKKLLPLVMCLLLSPFSFAQEITFTSDQVERGNAIYVEHCQICHGTNLDNGQFATPIKGFFFELRQGNTLFTLFHHLHPEGLLKLSLRSYRP